MKIISHRGNLTGSNPGTENNPTQIQDCIFLGLDVEVDLWHTESGLFLGHDKPEYPITYYGFLDVYRDYLWVHCKNFGALTYLKEHSYQGNYFYHENDPYTLTSNGYIWTYPKDHYDMTYEKQVLLDFKKISGKEYDFYLGLNIFALCVDHVPEGYLIEKN